jgi:hypothetical protein
MITPHGCILEAASLPAVLARRHALLVEALHGVLGTAHIAR